jgi:hypothetical protein
MNEASMMASDRHAVLRLLGDMTAASDEEAPAFTEADVAARMQSRRLSTRYAPITILEDLARDDQLVGGHRGASRTWRLPTSAGAGDAVEDLDLGGERKIIIRRSTWLEIIGALQFYAGDGRPFGSEWDWVVLDDGGRARSVLQKVMPDRDDVVETEIYCGESQGTEECQLADGHEGPHSWDRVSDAVSGDALTDGEIAALRYCETAPPGLPIAASTARMVSSALAKVTRIAREFSSG